MNFAGTTKDLKNQALGMTSILGRRCLEMYDDTKNDDIQSTLKAMNELLIGDSRNYRQLYELMATPILGGTGGVNGYCWRTGGDRNRCGYHRGYFCFFWYPLDHCGGFGYTRRIVGLVGCQEGATRG